LKYCFAWRIPDPPRNLLGRNVEGMTSYWGPDEDSAIVLPPGAEITVTQYLVAFQEYPLTVETSGPFEAPCEGASTTVLVDGQALTTYPTSATVFYEWSSAAPEVAFTDTRAASTEAVVQGIGTFPVKLTVSVGAYEASMETTVTVTDDVAPEWLELSADPVELWPPDHRSVNVHVTASVADECDPAPEVLLVGATSDEDVAERGSGRFVPDVLGADLATPDFDVELRAERSGRLDGRTYHLLYEAVDWAGNRSLRPLDIPVSHDRRYGPAAPAPCHRSAMHRDH
jgi:hypothetical protein